MQYSYENWASAHSQKSTDEPIETVSLSEDIQELEQSLGMTLDEAMAEYAPEKLPTQAFPTQTTEQVEAVLREYLQVVHQPLQQHLDKLWQIADTHYQDNKTLATQIQSLLGEREQLLTTLQAYEIELSRFQALFGNLYLKR